MVTQDTDICWEQRFPKYRRALRKLSDAVVYVQKEREAGIVFCDNVKNKLYTDENTTC